MALPVRSMTLTEAVDTTRTGSAWYFDENGVFQEESTSDTARIDYDPNGGARLGLMAEGQSTNLLTYSEDLSNAAWQKDACTIGTPTTFATNISLDEVVPTATNAAHNVEQNFSVTSGATVTLSAYVKANGYTDVTLLVAKIGVFGNRYSARFELDTETATPVTGAGNGTTDSAQIVDVGGGVFRVSVTGSISGTGAYRALLYVTDGSGSLAFLADGTSSVYMGGIQAEELPGASSYIPTTSAQVTRAAETHTLVSLDPWYRASGYSVAVQARLRNVTSNQALLALHDGDSENSVTVDLLGSASDPRVIVETGNVAQATIQSADAVSADTDFKVAARIAAKSFAASIDGNTAITDTSGDLPSPATTVVLGQSADDTLPMFGWIQDLKYTTTLWSDAELATESGTTV